MKSHLTINFKTHRKKRRKSHINHIHSVLKMPLIFYQLNINCPSVKQLHEWFSVQVIEFLLYHNTHFLVLSWLLKLTIAKHPHLFFGKKGGGVYFNPRPRDDTSSRSRWTIQLAPKLLVWRGRRVNKCFVSSDSSNWMRSLRRFLDWINYARRISVRRNELWNCQQLLKVAFFRIHCPGDVNHFGRQTVRRKKWPRFARDKAVRARFARRFIIDALATMRR